MACKLDDNLQPIERFFLEIIVIKTLKTLTLFLWYYCSKKAPELKLSKVRLSALMDHKFSKLEAVRGNSEPIRRRIGLRINLCGGLFCRWDGSKARVVSICSLSGLAEDVSMK